MEFKGCQRCNGDLWIEEDIGSRLEDLVCLQCGRHQAVQATPAGPNAEEHTDANRWLMSQRPSRVAA
jgi:hypothetical protein